jgi:hypothetical protein
MPPIVYRIRVLLGYLLCRVPVGTNLGLLHLLFALLSGRLLLSRGAVFPALADTGLSDAAVRRSAAALAYGHWTIGCLLLAWQRLVLREGCWQAHSYEGYRPLACDLVGFFRPHLAGCPGKHYTAQAGKALPALVFALVGAVGSIGKQRLVLPRLLLRQEPADGGEAGLQRRAIPQAAATLADDEVLVVDAGFALSDLLAAGVPRFVARVATNFTARRDYLPAYKGHGRPPEYGVRVRPLARKRKGHKISATPPDQTLRWQGRQRTLRAQVFEHLVLSDARPGTPSFRCVVIHDPRYQEPLVLVSNLPISAKALFGLYRDRWPIEQMPLAAKQMLGTERAFVFGAESRWRLPELALVAGNVLSYLAATSQPRATGFWDRCCRPTCGRLRRTLLRLHFLVLPLSEGQVRKKASITAHLPKGVLAHRRHKDRSLTGN